MELFEIAAVSVAAIASTIVAIFWMLKTQNQKVRDTDILHADNGQCISFLFDEESLHHASDAALKLYRLLPGRDDWAGLREQLQNRFPSLPETPMDAEPGETTVIARDVEDVATLSLKREGSFTRLEMYDEGAQNPAQYDRFKILQRELEDLRRASDTTNYAIWQVNSEGIVTWYNNSYRDLYQKLHGLDPDPNEPVFKHASGFNEKIGRQRVSTKEPGR